jgi:hypothetical protein
MEIYTVGRYTSGDIDIVSDERERLIRVLLHWEFKRPSRVFESTELGLVIDLVKPPYTGSVERTTLATTPFGPVRLAAIEDLLVKRLSSTGNWSRKSDLEHAKMLALQFADSLDWGYIEQYARVHSVLELAKQLRALVQPPKAR